MLIINKLLKQIYRYTHSYKYRHNETLWPFCHINRNSYGEINYLSYKNKTVPLISLTHWHNYFSGAVLVIATGPSINQINFSNLPKLPVFGVNGAYYLKDKLSFNLYMIVDTGFIDNRTNILKRIISDPIITLFTTIYILIRIIEKFQLESINCKLALIENISYRIFCPMLLNNDINKHYCSNSCVYFSKNHTGIAFTTDIRIGIFDAGTVVFWVLQILMFLGFKKFYIAGLDMNNFHSPRFYETKEDMLPSFLEEKTINLIIPAFELASKVLKEHNISVINLSLNSAISSNIFKKESFLSIFN